MFRRSDQAKSCRKSRERGFTLVELMMTLLILGLVMSVVYRVFSTQERLFRTHEQVASMQENIRATVEYINQEMSWMGYRVPGVTVVKASDTDIIYQANIPNTGTSIQYIRYQFLDSTDPSFPNTILRWAGPNPSSVAGTPERAIMATDIQAMSFSYYNVQNNRIVPPAGDPLCASVLPPDACSPSTPSEDDEDSLMAIQRVKTRVTARTTRPDWSYQDPSDSNEDSWNYRKRRAVIDVRARNVEDATIIAGQIGMTSCGDLTAVINRPSPWYNACKDKIAELNSMDPDLADNPSITITALDKEGNTNTLDGVSVTIAAIGTEGQSSPFLIYDDSITQNIQVDKTDIMSNYITRYISAGIFSDVSDGNTIEITLNYSDGVCTMMVYEDYTPIAIGYGDAAYFDTSGAYDVNGGLIVKYVDLDSGNPLVGPPSPTSIAMCPDTAREGVSLQAMITDECGNAVPDETVVWGDSGAGGSFTDISANADGTYTTTYVPPDSMSPSAAQYPVTLDAEWGASTLTVPVTLIAADPHDIIIDSIVYVNQVDMFDFTATVPSRAEQLVAGNNSSFSIERVSGQEIRIRFHIEDECGNRVYNVSPITVNENTSVKTTPVSHNDGSYTFTWKWDEGCGGDMSNTFDIYVEGIDNTATKTETITFNLVETDATGPFVLPENNSSPSSLQAGNTNDSVTIYASVKKYEAYTEVCTNIPGTFEMVWSLTGDTGGNGSFENGGTYPSDLVVSKTVTTNASGVASVEVYSGTADWDDVLGVTIKATIEEATYEGNINVDMRYSDHDGPGSGIYQDSDCLTKIGVGQTIQEFTAGNDLYFQIYDIDENEDPLNPDSSIEPYDVSVVVVSQSTGDRETVGLTEYADNVAKFRSPLPTEFGTSATAVSGDDVLQARDGDTITVSYEDKDNPGDVGSWEIKTPGADYFRVYLVDGATTTELVKPWPLQTLVTYGDHIRPVLSLPFLAGDGESGTVVIEVDAGDESGLLTLREQADGGIMVPDSTLYTNDYFTVSRTDPGPDDDVFLTPTTPRFVTLSYDADGAYARTGSFYMADVDPPDVTITSPVNGSTVPSQVTITVNVTDVNNAMPEAGISHVDLYINGRLIDSLPGTGPDDTYTFTWVTAANDLPKWLDGDHTIQVIAYDAAGNEGVSAPVGVTVANGHNPLVFTDPDFETIWSEDVDFTIQVLSLVAEAGTHDLVISVNGNSAFAISVTEADSFTRTVDLDSPIYGTLSNHLVTLFAVLTDKEGNYIETVHTFYIDQTEPSITIGSPFDQEWISLDDFDMTVYVTITDPVIPVGAPNDVDDSSVTGTFFGACNSGSPETMSPEGLDVYSLFWSDAACSGTGEGEITFIVEADDLATPPNHASRSATARIDVVRPTVNSLTVMPMVDMPFTIGSWNPEGFVRGDVTLGALVTDTYPATGVFSGLFYNDPFRWMAPDGTFTEPLTSSGILDATSHAFSDTWVTTDYPEGIYVLQASVQDEAGNSSNASASPERVVFVDNTIPQAWSPNVRPPNWAGGYQGLVYAQADFYDNFGYIRNVKHRYISTDDGSIAWAGSMSFSANELVRDVYETYVLDLSGPTWQEGVTYEVYAEVMDWAGNTYQGGPWTFTVDPTREVIPASPAVSFVETPDSSGRFEITVRGGQLVDGTGSGVGGETINVEVIRYIWDTTICSDPMEAPPCPVSGFGRYMGWAGDWITVPTAPDGSFPSYTFDLTSYPWMEFAATDKAMVNYWDSAWMTKYGTVEAYLNNPQPSGSPWDWAYISGAGEMLISIEEHMFINSGTTHYVSGHLLYTNSDPVGNETFNAEIWTPASNFTIPVTTQADGYFSISYPAQSDEWTEIDFQLPDEWGGMMWRGWMMYEPLPTGRWFSWLN